MSMIICPSCGEPTFVITGWADLDHCANCGEPLRDVAARPGDPGAAAGSRGPLADSPRRPGAEVGQRER